MSQHMEKNTRKWLILAILTAVAILAALWSAFRLQILTTPFGQHSPPFPNIPGDIEIFYIVQSVVSAINIALSIILLTIYVEIYRKTRSEFTIGLIIFSAIFLMNTLTSNLFVIRIFGFMPFGLGPFAVLPQLFTFLALAVLLYLSAKY
jgi:hypothetical protein